MTSHWSKTAVAELAAKKNIIDSSYGTAFKPDQPITRSEFAVMLSRGARPTGSTRWSFSIQGCTSLYTNE
ncbi:S-layer homology domain-containing protein [Paenibacillus rhizoplanae]